MKPSVMRFTKIVCTIGPASTEPEVLAQLVQAGMDVARLNFSHGDHTTHAENIRRLRAAGGERPLALLADLQGPKLRIGQIPAPGVMLEAGQQVQLTTDPANLTAIPCQYPDLPSLVKPGDHMLLDDGLLDLEVLAASDRTIAARVIIGGLLTSHKGINLPRADARIPAITDKDREDLAFAVAQGIDWVALSFVRTPQEVLELKALIRKNLRASASLDTTAPLHPTAPRVIAKIEKPEAVDNIAAIIEAADGIMVARGDLGIELPTEDVPMIQKQIIHLCNRAGKPVITATQMLDSMIRNPRPTRAEASDVANAVLDGTDAVMLSGETAAGRYPVRAVQTMDRIVRRAEAVVIKPMISTAAQDVGITRLNVAAQAIAQATSALASSLGAAAIIAPTASGYTARQLSRYRPDIPIIAVTPDQTVRRQLNLHKGVFPLYSERRRTTDEVVADAVQSAQHHSFVHEGDVVVITAGSAGSTPGTTNLIKVQIIEDVRARGIGFGTQKVYGRVRKLASPLPPDFAIDASDIVVAQTLEPAWQDDLCQAAGLIVEESGPGSVAARLVEEMHLPALLGAAGAFAILNEGELIALDPLRGLTYRGLRLDDAPMGISVQGADTRFPATSRRPDRESNQP